MRGVMENGVAGKLDYREAAKNHKPAVQADSSYIPAYVRLPTGQTVPALFTDEAVQVAMFRAEGNPQSVPPRMSKLKRVWKALIS